MHPRQAKDFGSARERTNATSPDEEAIVGLMDEWAEASAAGDVPTLLSLMTDDVVFMVPGKEPFGKEAFASTARALKDIRMEMNRHVKEIAVHGGWAWARTHLALTMTPPGGRPTRRSGYTLTIFRKRSDGVWLLARDANMLMPE
jgi:uncharacterized protein (TIGR02246 family)